jgi:hypothetical protein
LLDLHGFFLKDETLYPINVYYMGQNARTGKPETQLDFLNNILATPNSPGYNAPDTADLRKIIKKYYNAKTAKALLNPN